MARVLVLGGGFGGLAAAHELRRRLPAADEVVVIAASERFFVGFAKLWDLVGMRPLDEGSRELAALERHGIDYVQAEITGIDPAGVVTTSAGTFSGDGIVVALGANHSPTQTALLQPGGHDLYDAAALPGIKAALSELTDATVLISVLGAPYECPPAPFEAALLLDEWAREQQRGLEIVVSTPQPMTLPVAGADASQYLAERLGERGVTVLTGHTVAGVDHAARTAGFTDPEGNELPPVEYSVLLGVPAAAAPPVVAGSALAGAGGWIRPDPCTFATDHPRVYAVGDCTSVPTASAALPKAGAFAEATGQVAAANLAVDLHGGEHEHFDGHGFCFLELPGRQVATLRGDFYAEPSPDVTLHPPAEAAFAEKQRWERDRLAAWLG